MLEDQKVVDHILNILFSVYARGSAAQGSSIPTLLILLIDVFEHGKVLSYLPVFAVHIELRWNHSQYYLDLSQAQAVWADGKEDDEVIQKFVSFSWVSGQLFHHRVANQCSVNSFFSAILIELAHEETFFHVISYVGQRLAAWQTGCYPESFLVSKVILLPDFDQLVLIKIYTSDEVWLLL